MSATTLQTGLSRSAVVIALLLAGCDSGSDMAQLRQFVDETVNREPGPVEPLPEFISYEPFTYSASGMRSPFESPEDARRRGQSDNVSEVQPDLERTREPLESFSLSSLTMVGTLTRDNVRWALIRDGEGTVHRVTVGNYLGRNHGRIVAASESAIEIVEIVTSGDGGWIERPQTLSIGGQQQQQRQAGAGDVADDGDAPDENRQENVR